MDKITFTIWDSLVILSYFIILLILGYKAYKNTEHKSEKDFVLANRSLSLPAFIATLVTTWYGGILGIGEFTYLYGISSWVVVLALAAVIDFLQGIAMMLVEKSK